MFNQKTTDFCKQLNIRLPIIQAPMAGGIITPALISEVTKSGGLGSLPLGYLSIEGQNGGLIGAMALVPQMVDALNIPVIASGGIMDGRGIAAALTLGASAVQMGTAFLTCEESNASPLHKHMILDSAAESTCITSIFTGKPVRGFKNELVTTTEKSFSDDDLLPYPMQHQLTKELRSIANKSGRLEYAGLWSGQGNQLSRSLSVEHLMSTLEKETVSALSQFKYY